MPWIATDTDGAKYIYRHEPELDEGEGDWCRGKGDDREDESPMRCPDFPNAPAPGHKRFFQWPDVLAEPKLQPGDVVRFRSGGRRMTVSAIYEAVELVSEFGNARTTPETLERCEGRDAG